MTHRSLSDAPADVPTHGPTHSPAQPATDGIFRLPPALSGHRMRIGQAPLRLAAYVSRPHADSAVPGATPLLLIHSVNAAASAAEVRPIYETAAATRPVMALELPGFGSSDRPAVNYTPELMTQAVLSAVAAWRRLGIEQAVDVLAVSLSCEFVARAALRQPEFFRSLSFVSPTGLESRRLERYEDGRTHDRPWLRGLLERGPWSDALFRLLTSERSMRFFLRRAWGSAQIDETLLAYNRLSVRAPGARHAPYSFIGGALFTRGVAHLYERLTQPVWLTHGRDGAFNRFEGLQTLDPVSTWTVNAFDTGAMPYFQEPAVFMARQARFLAGVAEAVGQRRSPGAWPSDGVPAAPAYARDIGLEPSRSTPWNNTTTT